MAKRFTATNANVKYLCATAEPVAILRTSVILTLSVRIGLKVR